MENRNTSENCTCTVSDLGNWSEHILEEISIPMVGSIGIVGNIGAIVLLKLEEVKSTFHQSLLMLSILDIMFLACIISDHSMNLNSQIYIYLFPYIINPMKSILMSWETFLMMSIATERFLAVYKPIRYRGHKLRRSQNWHWISFILPSFLLSIVLNLPKFFETELVYSVIEDEDNEWVSKQKLDPLSK